MRIRSNSSSKWRKKFKTERKSGKTNIRQRKKRRKRKRRIDAIEDGRIRNETEEEIRKRMDVKGRVGRGRGTQKGRIKEIEAKVKRKRRAAVDLSKIGRNRKNNFSIYVGISGKKN